MWPEDWSQTKTPQTQKLVSGLGASQPTSIFENSKCVALSWLNQNLFTLLQVHGRVLLQYFLLRVRGFNNDSGDS